MTRTEKEALISELTQEFKSSSAIVVCNYKGLSVKKLESLRKNARKAEIKVQVIKNTLASLTLKNAEKNGLDLKETNIFVWGDEQISLSKLVCKFSDENKEFFVVKAGYFDDQVVDSNHIVAISKLPSKEELLGMLLSVWSAPARYFATALDNLRKKKEEN